MSLIDDRKWSDVIFGGGNTADPGLWGVGTAIYDVYNKNKGANDAARATETAARYSDPNAQHRGPAGDMYMDTLRNPQNWVNNPEMQAFDQHLQRTQLARDAAGGVRGSGAPERLAQREREAYMRLSNLRKDIAHMATGSPQAAGQAYLTGKSAETTAQNDKQKSIGGLLELARNFLDPSAGQDAQAEKRIFDAVRSGQLSPQQAQQMLQEMMLKRRMPAQGGGLKGLIDSIQSKIMGQPSAGMPGVGGTPNMDDWSGSTYGAEMTPGGDPSSLFEGGTGGIDPMGYTDMGSIPGAGDLSSLFGDLSGYTEYTGNIFDAVPAADIFAGAADVAPAAVDAFSAADVGAWTDAGGASELFW